jgi:multicomponent Na+:H+ antiporter subunit G
MINTPVINTLINVLSYGCIGLGLVFWFWGTWPLVGDRSVLYKLHSLSIADTLGSLSIVVGLLLKIPREWPLLLLAIFSLALWNTMLGYVLAYCASEPSAEERRGSAPEFFNAEFPDTLMSDRAERGDL